MVLYPEVQKRAHEELDRVIGNDRLPSIQDRESLPYINAICKELMRLVYSIVHLRIYIQLTYFRQMATSNTPW